MAKKIRKSLRTIGKNVNQLKWEHYKVLEEFTGRLNEVQNAAAIQIQKRRSAPVEMLSMVF